jgi:NAD(P)-dependent dehydrogenase (short-subunit alcohol dehydrogenase family)
VLCGLNELGYRTLEELLRLGVEVVVVVRSAAEELARAARELGATLVPGSYRDQAVLARRRGSRRPAPWSSPRTTTSATCTPPWPPRS